MNAQEACGYKRGNSFRPGQWPHGRRWCLNKQLPADKQTIRCVVMLLQVAAAATTK